MATHSKQIIEYIKTQLSKGTIVAGERLDEARLCEQFGVSRSPVRDALIQLEAFGLVERQGRSGAVVYNPSFDAFHKINEVHVNLETQAAGLAARRISNRQGKELEGAVEACRDFAVQSSFDAPLDYARLNNTFHRVIVDAAGNEFLNEMFFNSGLKILGFLRKRYLLNGQIKKSASDHTEIVAAILSNDVSRAEDLMHSHVTVSSQLAADLLAVESLPND